MDAVESGRRTSVTSLANRPPLRGLAAMATVGLAYYLVGRIGLLLALPPGYATAIWPAAGIALAAVLIVGPRVWPGIFVGSFLVNVGTSFDRGSVAGIAASLGVAVTIAGGAAMQAVVGAWLVRRFGKFPNPLASAREVFSLMILGGPLAGLVNASIGIGTLAVGGILDPASIPFSWLTWWAGDSIGVFIFTPLVLAWCLRPDDDWKDRRIAVSIPLAATFILAFVLLAYANSWEKDRLRLTFSQQAVAVKAAVAETFRSYFEVLYAVKSLYESSEEVSREEFSRFTDRYLKEYPGIQALSWNVRVTDAEHDALEARLRREVDPNIRIMEANVAGRSVPAFRRPEYVFAFYIEPLEGNAPAIGVNILSSPERALALNRAQITGEPAATGRVRLLQDPNGGYGFLVFTPVYKLGSTQDFSAERREAFLGYAAGVFRPEAALVGTLSGYDLRGIDVALYDKSASPGDRVLVPSKLPIGDPSAGVNDEDRIRPPTDLIWSSLMDVGGRQWELRLLGTQEYLGIHLSSNGWLVLTAGLLFASLVGAFSLVVTGRSVVFRRLVDERTRELGDSESRMRAIVENITDGIVTVDVYGNLETFNAAAERIFGYSRGEAVGRNVKVLLPSAYHAEIDDLLLDLRTGGGSRPAAHPREIEGRRYDGSTFPLEFALSEIDIVGQRKFIGIARDMTERRKVERMKMEFVSTVSHELRTPLTSIRGSLGLIVSGTLGALPDRIRDMVQLAHKNTARLIGLVNDILDVERLESGVMKFEDEKVRIADLVRSAVEDNRGYATEFNVTLSLKEPVPDVRVRGDGLRLAQVLANLISNATKFSPPGETVEISVRQEDYVVQIAVTDRGEGIPEHARSTIFERFTQGDASDSRRKGGTGLGLSIVRIIVERLGGRVHFESKEGVGTTFFVDLPIVVAVGEERGDGASDVGSPDPQPRIIVCVPDPASAEAISRMLSDAGYAARVALSAAQARTLLDRERFDLMAIDIDLPDRDGIALIRELRQRADTRDLSTIVISGRAAEPHDEIVYAVMGVVDWVDKPLDRNAFLTAIDRACRFSHPRPGDGKPKLLYVEDDRDLVRVVSALLQHDFDVLAVSSLHEARVELDRTAFDLVVLDVALPDGSGLDILARIEGRAGPAIPVVVFTGQEIDADVAAKVKAVMIKSRTSNENLLDMIKQALQSRRPAVR